MVEILNGCYTKVRVITADCNSGNCNSCPETYRCAVSGLEVQVWQGLGFREDA